MNQRKEAFLAAVMLSIKEQIKLHPTDFHPDYNTFPSWQVDLFFPIRRLPWKSIAF